MRANAWAVLQKLVDTDVSGAAFRFMDYREMSVAEMPRPSAMEPQDVLIQFRHYDMVRAALEFSDEQPQL